MAEGLVVPAARWTGVGAGSWGGPMRGSGGVKDVVAKVTGRRSNPINIVYATLDAVKRLRTPEEIYRLRGKERKEA